MNNKVIREVNGCLSTGKEANVYHALSYDGEEEYAIKIYKTSILIFKDRDRYVEGEVLIINKSLDLDMVIVRAIQEKWLKCGQKKNLEI